MFKGYSRRSTKFKMNTPAIDGQAEFLLIEANKRIDLKRMAESTRLDYYRPNGMKDWIVTAFSLVYIIYLGLLAKKAGNGIVFLGLVVAVIVFTEIRRLEMKIDAFVKLSKMKNVEPSARGDGIPPPQP